VTERRFKVRCPRCGSRDVHLAEQFTVWDDYTLRKGVLVDIASTVRPRVTGRLVATCDGQDCDHQWMLRRSIDELEVETSGTPRACGGA
jgi:hypothetical protein